MYDPLPLGLIMAASATVLSPFHPFVFGSLVTKLHLVDGWRRVFQRALTELAWKCPYLALRFIRGL